LAVVDSLLKDTSMHDKGRRLDFTIQELMREINTITSKCAHFEITSLAVEVKVLLEKAREQIQNVV
jgi:uncharacterized protein (TIGR00255 family)